MTQVATTSILTAFLTSAAAACDGDVLARAALNSALAPLGAIRVAIYVASADGAFLYMVGHSGGDEVRRLYSTLPVDGSTPNAVAFSTGTEILLSLAETTERFPVLSAATALYTESEGMMFGALPLRHAGDCLGTLGVLFSTPPPRTWESREVLDSTCAVTALWCAAHLTEARSGASSRTPVLTTRQRAVLRLAALGMTNAQIADHLGFAPSTIKGDLTSLYRVTGARSRSDLLERTTEEA